MNKKEAILKAIIIVGIILLCLVFPGSVFIALLIEEPYLSYTIYIILALLLIDGVTLMVLLPIWGGTLQGHKTAERRRMSFDNYEVFYNHLRESLIYHGYCELQRSSSPLGEIIIYRFKKRNVTQYMVILRCKELSNVFLDRVENILASNCDDISYSNRVEMVIVFCVDRVNALFRKHVNCDVMQGDRKGRLPIGVSFGGKQLYLANHQGGIGAFHYSKLKKDFLKIFNWNKDG